MSTSGGGTNIEVNVDASQAIQSFERLKAEYRDLLTEFRKGSQTTGKGRGFERVEAQRRLSETAELEAQTLYESDPDAFAHLEPTVSKKGEEARSLTTGEAGAVARSAMTEVDKEIVANEKLARTVEEKKRADEEATAELRRKAEEQDDEEVTEDDAELEEIIKELEGDEMEEEDPADTNNFTFFKRNFL